MAGLRGNVAWLGAAKQTAKGAAATAPVWKNPFSGGSIAPTREVDQLAETDSSRDRGVSYVQSSGVEGNPEVYVRDDSIGFYLLAALGADVVTGVSPNFVHTLTPANGIPYLTFWRNIGDTLFERFEDCQVSQLGIKAESGNPLQATANIQGLRAVRLTADPAGAAVTNEAVYTYNEAAVTLGGTATALIRSFDLTIDNNVTRQQTDDVVPYDIVPQQRQISLGFDIIFETLNEYNKFHYGGVSGTAISSSVYTTSASFTFSKGTNNEITFNLPRLAYEEFPVEPNPGGDPITVSVRAVGERGATPILTSTVKCQTASY